MAVNVSYVSHSLLGALSFFVVTVGMRRKTEEVRIKNILKSPKTACAWCGSALQPDTLLAVSHLLEFFF